LDDFFGSYLIFDSKQGIDIYEMSLCCLYSIPPCFKTCVYITQHTSIPSFIFATSLMFIISLFMSSLLGYRPSLWIHIWRTGPLPPTITHYADTVWVGKKALCSSHVFHLFLYQNPLNLVSVKTKLTNRQNYFYI
jgi:hypothetical protein